MRRAPLGARNCFNPRLRAGGDAAKELRRAHLQVSIHASVREATRRVWTRLPQTSCFNPRLRAGGDEDANERDAGQRVSIHASVREATTMIVNAATLAALFQSTPPCGRRRGPRGGILQRGHVSIHASVREATRTGSSPARRRPVSIHASVREATRH